MLVREIGRRQAVRRDCQPDRVSTLRGRRPALSLRCRRPSGDPSRLAAPRRPARLIVRSGPRSAAAQHQDDQDDDDNQNDGSKADIHGVSFLGGDACSCRCLRCDCPAQSGLTGFLWRAPALSRSDRPATRAHRSTVRTFLGVQPRRPASRRNVSTAVTRRWDRSSGGQAELGEDGVDVVQPARVRQLAASGAGSMPSVDATRLANCTSSGMVRCLLYARATMRAATSCSAT
jgi:hypothetical protein